MSKELNKEMSVDKALFEFVPSEDRNIVEIARPSVTYWQDAWRIFKSNKVALGSAIVILIIVLLTIFVPMFSTYSYSTQDLTNTNAPMSSAHLFGTDNLGRDLFVRVWYGTSFTLIISLLTMVISLFIGVIYGGIAGFIGGIVDNIMMRVIDILYAVPVIIYAILMMVWINAAGGDSFIGMIIAITLTSWLLMARIVRGEILQLKEQEFILAAKTLGAPSSRILFGHLIPNSMGATIVTATLIIPSAIFTEAFLSFIGLGISAPKASLGTLCSDGVGPLLAGSPNQLLFPAAVISIIILCFNLIGDGLIDALDPKMRK